MALMMGDYIHETKTPNPTGTRVLPGSSTIYGLFTNRLRSIYDRAQCEFLFVVIVIIVLLRHIYNRRIWASWKAKAERNVVRNEGQGPEEIYIEGSEPLQHDGSAADSSFPFSDGRVSSAVK